MAGQIKLNNTVGGSLTIKDSDTLTSNRILDLSQFSTSASGSSVYGLIHNKTADTYKRFGTGTPEDNIWLSTFAERLNTNSNSDLVTQYFNNNATVQGAMKRVVLNDSGAYVRDYNATGYTHTDQTGLSATETVMVSIPKFYYISIEFMYKNDTYNLYAQSLATFSIDLSAIGFSGATSILGQNVTNYKSYLSIVGTVITAKVHDAFNHATEGEKSTLYVGAFESSNGGTNYKSTCTTTGTSTSVYAVASQTIATFRAKHLAFGARFQTQNWLMREAVTLSLLIERGTYQTETNGSNNYSKWEAYSWRTGATSDDQKLGLTLGLLNTTGVIKNASNQTIAVSYRGIENPYGHLWEFVDGCNIISGGVWLAKHGSTYLSDTTASPYFTSGRTTLAAGVGVYISDVHEGTFIPSATTGATNVTKMTDGGWFAGGNTVLRVGGLQNYPGISGSLAWYSGTASSLLVWDIGSRFGTLA